MQRNISFHKFIILGAIIAGGSNVLSFYLANLSFLPFIFKVLAATSIASVSLALGIRGAFLSAVLAVVFSCIIQPVEAALYFSIVTIFPALLIGTILNIVTVDKETTEARWLPLSSILFNLCVISVITVILFAIYVNSTTSISLLSPESFASTKKLIDENIKSLFSQIFVDEVTRNQMLEFYNLNFNKLAIFTVASETITSVFITILLCIYISTNLVTAQHLSPRPLSFWPRDLSMPAIAIPLWFIAIISTSLVGSNYTAFMCAISICFAFTLGFVASGIAFIHQITLGKLWRFAILVPTYFLLFSGVFTAIIFIILVFLGLASSVTQARDNLYQQPKNPSN